MSAAPAVRYRFGRAEVRAVERQLLLDGRPANLGARAFDVLLTLIERRDGVVTKTELLDLVWPNLVVEENNLQVQVSTLRKLLGPAAIATIPGRGYRFAALLADDAPAPPPAATASGAAGGGTAGNLPAALPRLIGRDVDLAGVAGLVLDRRLVTLVGAAGIGKTRLAQAVAHRLAPRFADGAWMVELAPLDDPAALAATVAHTLRITLPGTEAPLAELAQRLRGASMLVVLDNCEHMIDPVSVLAQALLDHAPGLRLLATSQQRLRLADEQVVRLSTLSVPDGAALGDAAGHGAVALFVERAAALQPGFELDARNVEAVVDICRHLDGMALALELAAARVPVLGVEGVRAHLAERFRMLIGGGPRVTLPRHRTLHAALDWSHGLLSAHERIVFRRLGVFVGSFGLELVQHVACDDAIDRWAVLDHLGALIDKSMVVVDAGDPPRYRLLETARDYARERLAQAGETAALQQRHAEGVHATLEPHLQRTHDGSSSMDAIVRACVPEIDNLRAAIEWASGPEGDLRLAVVLAVDASELMYHAGRYPECARWMLALAPRVVDTAVDAPLSGRFRFGLALVGLHGGVATAHRLELLEQARRAFEQCGDRAMLTHTLAMLVYVSIVRNDFEAAGRWLDACRSSVRPDDAPFLRLTALFVEGLCHRFAGRPEAALRCFAQALPLAHEVDSTRYVFYLLNSSAAVQLEMDRVDEAVARHRALLDHLRHSPLADTPMLAFALLWLALDLTMQGNLDEARLRVQEGLPYVRRSVGVRHFSGTLALLAARLGRLADAARWVGADDAARRRRGEPRNATDERLLAATLEPIVASHPDAAIDAWRAEGFGLDEDAAAALAAELGPGAGPLPSRG